ncbi:MAG: GDYXXLXY domain-containing protein [Pseudanabaenaceae cyanobacterium SKYGB_i_bin29]|nr:GDYXXLXY domain-containing protein [Pseudanabaenaceae cyanobacterium SKYG29]MDW8420245.1 GDYXXLXY domain-containing protein [Pseudanabaenaceae cyanobacterium SKYGB_i_bin29]
MKLPYWRLVLPLMLQIAIPLSMATEPFTVVLTGTTVYLQTVPVDPYDILRGYSQIVNYEFSSLSYLQSLPGGKNIDYNSGTVYVVFVAPKNSNSTAPAPWQPVRVSTSFPGDLSPQEIAVKGTVRYEQVIYGIEELYFPEAQREQINTEAAEATHQRQAIAEVKVGRSGKAVLRALWLGNKAYRF